MSWYHVSEHMQDVPEYKKEIGNDREMNIDKVISGAIVVYILHRRMIGDFECCNKRPNEVNARPHAVSSDL